MKISSCARQPLRRPESVRDLLPNEQSFLVAMQRLRFGRYETVRIRDGELVLDPWPTTVRHVRFCDNSSRPEPTSDEFLLKQQIVELLVYIRAVDTGCIRRLEVRHGLPFSMEIEYCPDNERRGQSLFHQT